MNVLKDNRIPQVRKMILSIVPKVDLPYIEVLVTRDNKIMVVSRETVLYLIDLNGVQPNFDLSFRFIDIMNLEEDCYIHDNLLLDKLIRLYSLYFHNIMNPGNLLASEPILRDNTEFEKLLSLKSADGMKFYKMNGNIIGNVYYIPIFSGFPSINKNDKIGIDVYDMRDNIHSFAVMNIFKKKVNRNIKMCFRFINL